jgi:hypothetical protein
MGSSGLPPGYTPFGYGTTAGTGAAASGTGATYGLASASLNATTTTAEWRRPQAPQLGSLSHPGSTADSEWSYRTADGGFGNQNGIGNGMMAAASSESEAVDQAIGERPCI